MKLTEVLAGIGAEQQSGSRASLEVTGVAHDSRKVKPGDLFVAIPGATSDGANFVGDAKQKGAIAVVAQRPVQADGPIYQVANARQALALISANFYRKPAGELMLLGVTGTNPYSRTHHATTVTTSEMHPEMSAGIDHYRLIKPLITIIVEMPRTPISGNFDII